MIRPRTLAALGLIAATVAFAVYYSAGATAEAGLFFRRDGAARQPVRTVAAAIASRRQARGAPIVFPRLHAAALQSSGAASGGSTGSTASACTSAECNQAEQVAAAANAERNSRRFHFARALSLFAQAQDDPEVARAVIDLQRNPAKAAAFRAAVQERFGFTPDTIREWLKLFLEFAPQIIDLILKFV